LKYLLDTNVWSELLKPRPEDNVRMFLKAIDPAAISLSVITLAEMQYGVFRMEPGRRRSEREQFIEGLATMYEERIMPVSKGVGQRWAELRGDSASRGRPLPVIDALIAATALHHDLTLVTRNVRDFEGTGVKLADPWQESAP
jgi:predicted nucleic acid-binding protein